MINLKTFKHCQNNQRDKGNNLFRHPETNPQENSESELPAEEEEQKNDGQQRRNGLREVLKADVIISIYGLQGGRERLGGGWGKAVARGGGGGGGVERNVG